MPALTRLLQGLGGVPAPSSAGLSALGRVAAGPGSAAAAARCAPLRSPAAVACPAAAAAPLLQRAAAWRPRCAYSGPGCSAAATAAAAGLGPRRVRRGDGPTLLGSGSSSRPCSSGISGSISGRISISSGGARRGARCHAAAADGGAAAGGTIFTLPTILTLGRVAAVPAIVAAWFWSSPHATAAVTGLFVAAALTDWLDGYLARKLNASSKFGAFLDPVADKLMVAAALILLCTQPLAAGPLAGNAWLVPASTLVIIGREITMSALREWAATLGPTARDAVAVNAWGKWKTASQMVALTALLATRDGVAAGAAAGLGEQLLQASAAVGPPLLLVAAYLSAHSLALYLRGLWRFMA